MEIVFAQILAFFVLLIFQMIPTFFAIHYGFDVSYCKELELYSCY